MVLDKILEHILQLFYSLSHSYGLSIIFLSLAVSLFLIPLFWFVDKLQQKDHSLKELMKPSLDKLHNLKNRQEKYFYTKEIYKKNNYNPYQSLVGLLGLVIQIPFFLAAYIMLEQFEPISNVAFGPINNLALSDGLIEIRGVFINLLPLIMTATNLLSIKLFTNNSSYKEKVQLIAIALIFLALLYNSSAALVLYWTMNNVFAIGKNWFITRVSSTKKTESNTQENSLRRLASSFFLKYQRETYTTIIMWAIYFLGINYIIDKNLSICFSSILAALISILLLDLLILATFIDTIKHKNKGRLIVISAVLLVGLSHMSIIYARFTSLTAYDFFKFVIACQLVYLFVYTLLRRKRLALKVSKKHSFSKSDLLITLIILFPLINYLFTNIASFNSLQSWILYFGILLCIPVLIYFLLNIITYKFVTRKYTFISFLALTTCYYSVPYLTSHFKVIAETNIVYHFLLLIIITSIFTFLYYNKKKLFSIISIALCATALTGGIISSRSNHPISTDNTTTAVYTHLEGKSMMHQPDIYFLIYDAYVSEKQMNFYGIDNKAQMNYLKANNFTFYDNTYTLWMGSLGSMSRVLDMDQIDGETEKIHRNRIANSTINKVLQENGYKTHFVLHPYFYAGSDSIYTDYVYPALEKNTSPKPILKSIFLGEFKVTLELDGEESNYENTCIEKRRIINSEASEPKFMYSHSFYPSHSVLSGKCLPYERSRYEERLGIANEEMTEDINTILSQDNDAIIIIAGDHGAYLTGDCNYLENYKESDISSTELVDRFGMFLAIRYPNVSYVKYNQEIVLLQDIFFSVLSDLFEDRDLMQLRLEQSTYKVNDFIPEGAVKNGIINYGTDIGKPLYWDIN